MPLNPVEQALVEHVERGEVLDLAGDGAVDEDAMASWDESHTVSATVIRDIVQGRLVAAPDPRGLRLRGARIQGRIDLRNITSAVAIELRDCLIDEGLNVRNAALSSLELTGCLVRHATKPALDGEGLTANVLDLCSTTAAARCDDATVLLSGADLGDLFCSGTTLHNESGPALAAEDARVRRHMSFREGFTATASGRRGAVILIAAHLGSFICRNAVVSNKSGSALVADGLQVDHRCVLAGQFGATGPTGTIRMVSARIGRELNCSAAKLHNDSGPAFAADGLRVEGTLFLQKKFEATGSGEAGTVRLLSAHLGRLQCRDAVIHNESGPAFVASSLQVDQDGYLDGDLEITGATTKAVLDLRAARIGGVLRFHPKRLENRTEPQARLNVDGLTYTGLPAKITTGAWLKLLREGTPGYAAQPYQQFATAHRAAGHDREARRILMTQRRDQIQRRALTGRAERAWARTTGLLLGYGYQPWRALLCLLAVMITAVTLAVVLGGSGGLAHTVPPPPAAPSACTVVERIGVGLDLGTPLLTTGARTRCDTTASATGQVLAVSGWTLRLLAWAFATLFIAGFTGAVRKT